MNLYNPEISTALFSVEELQDRREVLATLGRSGTKEQQKSQARKAEMSRVTQALLLRGVQPRPAARTSAPANGRTPGDTALVQAYAVAPLPRPQGLRGYSTAVASAQKAYAPKPYSVYA